MVNVPLIQLSRVDEHARIKDKLGIIDITSPGSSQLYAKLQ